MSDLKRMWEVEDLPLFSGTPIRAEAPQTAPDSVAHQRSLPHKWGLCKHTGVVMNNEQREFCWCDAGLQAWDRVQRRED